MNINNFELYIDELILERGRSYYNAGNIIVLEYNGAEWAATVEGSDDYTVALVISENHEIIASECDCPYDHGKYCKHKAAVFYAVRDKIKSDETSAEPVKNLTYALKSLSKQALLSIILDFAGKGVLLKEEHLWRYIEKRKASKPGSTFKHRGEKQRTGGSPQITDWQKSMNKALDYIENNLSGEIDYSAAARCMNCSVWEFQRLFSFMAQLPLSDYIRRRRLTLAASDIRRGQDKIIDIALRYSYDSHASFSRAFTQLHGTTPKSARSDGATLKVFPRLDFRLADKAAAPVSYRVEQKKPFQVIGITKRFTADEGVHNGGIGKLWAYWYYNKLKERFYIKYANAAKHDMCVSLPINNTDEFYYTVGFLYSGAKNTDGFNVVDIPGGTYIVFNIPGEYIDKVGEFMDRCITEYIPSAGYEPTGTDAEYFPDNKKGEAWFLVK